MNWLWELDDALLTAAWLVGAALVGWGLTFPAIELIRRAWASDRAGPVGRMIRRWRFPAAVVGALIALRLGLAFLLIPPEAADAVRHVLAIGIIGSVGWLAVVFIRTGADLIEGRYRLDVRDNLEARKIHTQIRVLERILILIVALIAVASVLTTFDRIRQLGVSLLDSAGIAGVILGFAAQRSLGLLLAGVQIAITQPIRIDDVVIVEGHWGRIEEITLTYVVIRVWDLRRLVVPINYFIERPFENWTRTSADMLGTIHLYVDYAVPVDPLREELKRIVRERTEWDGKVCVLQVTGTSERTVELRALVSSADSGRLWDLRAHVRVRLLDFIRDQYPACLPRVRAEIDGRGSDRLEPPKAIPPAETRPPRPSGL